MPGEGSVTAWVNSLAGGDADAAGPLWERYFSRMVRLARGRLPGRAADAEDVALSAFHEFCRAAAAGDRFPQMASRDDLWHVLVVLTGRKAVDWLRHQTRQKRSAPGSEPLPEDVPGPAADPALDALVADEIRSLFARLPSDELRRVADLKLEGRTNPEIAEQLGCTVRSVCRRLALIREVWEAPGGGNGHEGA